MSVGINFGAATSGTGFDVATTVSSIMAIERAPEKAWEARTAALQAQDTVISALGTDVAALTTALASLTSFDGIFAAKTGATSSNDSVVLSSVSNNASAGTHTLSVQALAQTSQDYSSVVGPSATLSGTLRLTVGSGAAIDLNVAAGSTVSQVAAQINASSAGVLASVVTDSNGSSLIFGSKTAGAAGQLTIDSSGLTDSAGNTLTVSQYKAGQDASYTLDGRVGLTSSSNTVSTALAGVTFQLVGTTPSGASGTTLQIVADTSAVSTALTGFVTAYNTLTKALTAQEGKDSSGAAQPLFGTSVVQQLQSGLATALSFTAPGTSPATRISLSTLGITTSTDGTLTLDTSALSTALSSRLGDVESFFQDSHSFGQNLTAVLSNLGISGNGALGLAVNTNSTEEATLAANKTNLELRLSAYETRLTAELTTANEILQSIPSTLKGITALFNAITGNNND